jgi:hypothetical protein
MCLQGDSVVVTKISQQDIQQRCLAQERLCFLL